MPGSSRLQPSSASKASQGSRFLTAASSRRNGRSTRPSCRCTPSPRSSSSGFCSTIIWRSGRNGFRSSDTPSLATLAVFTTGQATIPAAASGMPPLAFPDGDPHLLPVRVRRHHRHHPGRLGSRPHELHGMDDLLPGVDDARLYGRGVQPLGRRLARRPGRRRLFRRLRDPSRGWHFGLCRRLGRRAQGCRPIAIISRPTAC